MQAEFLTACPGALDDAGARQVADLLQHVQLAEPVQALFAVGQAVEALAVFAVDDADVLQPVVDQTEAQAVVGGGDTAAAIVADDEDMPDFQHVDRVLQHGEAVKIRVADDVGDVAVDEYFTRRQPDNLVGRHPRIRAADPQVLRRLL